MIYQVHKQEGTHAGTRGMVTVFSFPETRSLKPGKQRVNTWGIIASDTGRQTETETPHFKVSGHGTWALPGTGFCQEAPMSTKRTSRDSPLKPVTKLADRRGLRDCNADPHPTLPFPSTPFPFLFLTRIKGRVPLSLQYIAQ